MPIEPAWSRSSCRFFRPFGGVELVEIDLRQSAREVSNLVRAGT